MQCYISPNLMKKQTHLHLGWPDGIRTCWKLQQVFIFGLTIPLRVKKYKLTFIFLTRLFTAFFITVIRAVILPITAPWQPHTSTRHTAKLISHAHRRTWRWERGMWQMWNPLAHTHTTIRQLLTAVLFIGLVVAVVFSVTPPASIYTHATAAHELCRTAGLVGGCVHTQTHTESDMHTHTHETHLY